VSNAELQTRVSSGYVVVVLRGELDTTDAEAAAGAVAALAADGRPLLLDLGSLDFIDCHAADALLAVRKTARQAGGDVLLAAPYGSVLRLLTLLGVPDVYASVEAAADSAGRRAARRRAVSIARPGRAVLSGARYQMMVWKAGSRAGNRNWPPRWLRSRSRLRR
jgi:anti-sigma B factor antagonist